MERSNVARASRPTPYARHGRDAHATTRSLTLLAAIICLVNLSALAADIPFVANGQSDFAILLPKTPSPAESFAAKELARYLQQMTGHQFLLQPPGPVPDAAHLLVVSTFDNLGTTGLPINFRMVNNPDACTIAGNPKRIFLVGRSPRAVLYAVYDFLDALGCRFLAPNLEHYKGSAEVIPNQANLAIPESVFDSTVPKLAFRKIYVEEGHSHTPENLAQIVDWMPKVGYNTLVVPTNYGGAGKVKWDNFRDRVTPECQKRGITIEVGGHGYQNFLNSEMEDGKLFDHHPEYFGEAENGQRQKGHNRVFCTSNPAAVNYLITNFIAYIKSHPEIQIYDFWPPDGAKWCECDNCKKLGTPSDRQALLISQVKAKANKARPDLRLEIIAYAAALRPPEHVKLDKSILLDFCPIGQQFDHQINDPTAEKNADYVTNVTAWRKAFDGDISIYSYYRKYAWDSLPVIIPHYMQKDLQFYATIPVQGVSTYAEPDDWFTYELNHYVLGVLAWDPNADVDAVVEKFCDARYDSASAAAREALMLLEKTTRIYSSIPNISLKENAQLEQAAHRIATMSGKVQAARDMMKAPSSLHLEKLNRMLQYAHGDLVIQQMRAQNAPKDQMRSLVDRLHQLVQDHADEGVFLVKDHRLSTTRMNKRYGL